MGINISNKVSDEDKQAVVNSSKGGDTLSDDEINAMFSDSEDLFADFDTLDDDGQDVKSSPWGSDNNITGNSSGDIKWGTASNAGQPQTQQSKSDEAMDKAFDATVEASKNLWEILKEIKASLKHRTLDDYGYVGTVCIKKSGIITLVGAIALVICILGGRSNTAIMTAVNCIVCGMILFAIGIVQLFVSAYLLSTGVEIGTPIDEIPDIQNSGADVDDSSMDDMWGDLFDDEEEFGEYEDKTEVDDDEGDDWFSGESSSTHNDSMSMFDTDDNEEIDSDKVLNNINENVVLTRKYLVDTFMSLLPLSSPKFHEKNEIYSDNDTFVTIEAICSKALSNIANCDITEIGNVLDKLYETDFSYILYVKRIKKITNLTSIAREMEAYFRDSSTDYAVTAKVDIEGDFYKVVVSKGETETVTIGDVLNYDEYYKQFTDEKCRLPIIYGMDELGNINMGDAKLCDSTLIAGKQRSGKSWYLLGMLMCLMLFNTPEAVQFILIDPKDTALFKYLSWMPHVAGVHTAKGILDVLDDVINNEGAYRKKILKDNDCDTIWELWDKGIKLPILYICIDEYITALDSLGDRAKELNQRLLVIKTQFPSQGIRVIFIPHRATGVVDKTNRATTSLKVAVRTDLEDTKDTLGEQKWDRPLINPGDLAMRAPNMMHAEFMRGVALGRSDEENRDIIEASAKAFYKMGVDLPDMSRMPIACNRNSEAIRAELTGESIREQYNANSIYSMLEEL